MKKLKLKALDLGAKELLSREQLKNILGGSGSDLGGSNLGCAESAYSACGSRPVPHNCCFVQSGIVYHGVCRKSVYLEEYTCSDLN
ncbi:hypothetical protein CLV59_108141 [Chitinophaga dinghuensis]|uniref:Natural product n=1 Tax=Chitinophaga dinghuensis TaxID=1539050 RepID=A0A327VXY7_9BACT|nr:hypothetical protein [Chitinophaga dinghuensis]RAJ76622.1 hypothetical protein CLV59_108141 [Chitinophaga dinghuensis]